MTTGFGGLGVSEPLVAALQRAGIEEPFEIQTATIPDLLDGRDLCGRAPTGSGKTLAFGIPLVETVAECPPRRPEALVLAPTRELAIQIADELDMLAVAVDRNVVAVFGGSPYNRQKKAVAAGVDILVATPGRLEDMIQQGDVRLDRVNAVVIDEADRMADMGFLPPVSRLLDQCASDRQTILFSATLDGDVATLIRRYQDDPVRHEIGDEAPDIHAMQHRFWEVGHPERVGVAAGIIERHGQTIVFVRTRHGADRIARQLGRFGIKAVPIHGNRSQNQRETALKRFDEGTAQALVATDVAARGIHVDDVSCVIHFDPPGEDRTYVHRSGRTARAGAEGLVISLIQKAQIKDVRRMQKALGLPTEIDTPDVEIPPQRETHATKDKQKSGGGGSRSRSGGNDRRSKGGKSTGGKGNGGKGKSSSRGDSKSADRDGQRRGEGGRAKSDEREGGRKTSKPGQRGRPSARRDRDESERSGSSDQRSRGQKSRRGSGASSRDDDRDGRPSRSRSSKNNRSRGDRHDRGGERQSDGRGSSERAGGKRNKNAQSQSSEGRDGERAGKRRPKKRHRNATASKNKGAPRRSSRD